MAESLTFTIEPGSSGVVSLELFLRTVDRVSRFVQEVDFAVTGDAAKWILVGMHSSYPTLTIAPPPGHDPIASLGAIGEGLAAITGGHATEPPPHFTEGALDGLREMRPLFGGLHPRRGIEYLRQIDFSLNGSGKATVDAGIQALGSIEGRLQRINIRGRPSFTIWDRVSDTPVRCFFPAGQSWNQQVAAMLDRRVLAVGTIHYFRNGMPRYVKLQQVLDRTPDPTLAAAYFGCIPDLTDGLDTEEYLRRLREGLLGGEGLLGEGLVG